MRIMQVNTFAPTRQNRMAFRGEEKELSLSKQIEEVKAELEDKGLFAQAEYAYLEINGKASEKIYGGSTAESDIEAFVDSGIAYARSITTAACKQDEASQLKAADKIGNAVKAFGAMHNAFPNLEIRNPIIDVLTNLPIMFHWK